MSSGRRDALGRDIKVSEGAGVRADAPPPPSHVDFAGREALIEAGGHAEALAVSSAKPWPVRDASSWWSNRLSIAEHNHADGDYPMLPERGVYDTMLRTYRRCYQGGANAVRIASKSAVNRFADKTGGTFDMPAEVLTAEGPVSTNVRCTRVADGVWHVTPTTANPSRSEVAAAEAVRVVLEAQRPALALERVGDLVARAERRVPVGAVRRRPVDSSFIQAVGFGRRAPVVTVEMRGQVYGYATDSVRAGQFLAAMQAGGSLGAAYNEFIKGEERVEMRSCGRCGVRVARGPGMPRHLCEVHDRRGS